LPFDRIKIDKSFVGSLLSSDQSEAIVATITNLAKALNLPVTAEGVETDAVVQRLRLLGCREGQGWLFGRAAPGAQIREQLGLVPTGGPATDPIQVVKVSADRRDHLRRSSQPRKCA
jgi:EAL domain-containing protein (putative c-di-GMP-specific phosphodiesterase class I)